MVQSTELTLDDAADAAIRAQWSTLHEAGLPSLARHASASNRPHLTLDARAEVSPESEARLREVAAALPIPVHVGDSHVFHNKRGNVLVRRVDLTPALLDLHARVHAALGPGGSALSVPGNWMPHLTLAHGLSDEQTEAALALVGTAEPLAALAVRLRRWDSDTRRSWHVTGESGP